MAVPNMPAIVNAIPEGWLSILQLKQTGRNPSAAAEFIQPQMDLTDWYAAATAETASSTTTTRAAVGIANTDLVVPQDETWLVASLGWSATTVAGITAARVQGGVLMSNAAGSFVLYPSDIYTFAGGRAEQAFIGLPGPFILRPGDTVVVNVADYTGAGNITLQAFARIARLRL